MRKVQNGKEIMKRIRVFSVTAHSKSVVIRMHRVQQLRYENAYAESDFPWSFEFVVLNEIEGQYDKMTVSRLILGILFRYGVKRLLPELQRAIEAVVQKANEGLMDESGQLDEPSLSDGAEPPGGTQQSDNGPDHAADENDSSQRPSTGVGRRRQQSNSRSARGSKQARNATGTQRPSSGSRKRAAEQDLSASIQSKASKHSQLSELRGMVTVLKT